MSLMRDEILEQPAALARTLQAEWPEAERLRAHLAGKRIRFVMLAARGTSDNAAQFARYLIEITTGLPVGLAAPSVHTLYEANLHLEDSVVIAVSQSGESTDTNLVLERAKETGAFTIGITNEPGSTLARLADHTFLVRAGKERSVAATKTYTGQLLCSYMAAYALGASIRIEALQKLPRWCERAIELEPQISRCAERYCFMQHAVCVGRGLSYANSFEFALKLMETCYVVAERFSSADLLHGPIAMLEANFPAFLLCPAGVTWKPMCELIDKLQSIRAETLVITDAGNKHAIALESTVQNTLVIPESLVVETELPLDLYTPIPYIIPAQLFAASLAEVKRLDPDRPRTLSKVTQTI
jgi:glucosamine--fructose-6-phosphate aminotransferase (isomerizing)